MKKIAFISFITISMGQTSLAQNLVPNGSFEEYKKIPLDMISNLDDYVDDWLSPTTGSPDYFHELSNGLTSVPIQKLNISYTDSSLQQAKDGIAFVGFFNWFDEEGDLSIAEYLQVRLIDSLKENHVYKFDSYFNLLDISRFKGFEFAFILSKEQDTSYSDESTPKRTLFKQEIRNYTVLEQSRNINSTDWTSLNRQLKAKGGEVWLTIGCFDYEDTYKEVYRTDVEYYDSSIKFAYYFIDDVSLVEIPSLVGPDTVCVGEVVELYSSFYGASCAWYGDADKAVLLSSDTFLSVEANISQWYYLETDIGSDSLFITVIPKPLLIAMPDTFYCSGEILSINVADRVTQSTSISWFDADSLFKKTFQLEGEYWFNVSNRFCSVLDTFRVVEKSNPETMASKEITICQMENHYDTIYLDSTLNYFWDDIGPQNFLRIFNENGIVKYQVTNKFGCYTDDSIRILDICMPVVYIPNAFVIGGYNNEFRPYLRYVLESELSIFNRWGEKIFTSADLNPVWDGTLHGEEQQEGVYLYLLTTKSSFGIKIYNGTFHLLKK